MWTADCLPNSNDPGHKQTRVFTSKLSQFGKLTLNTFNEEFTGCYTNMQPIVTLMISAWPLQAELNWAVLLQLSSQT